MCIISFEMERKCVSKKKIYIFIKNTFHFLVSDQNENRLTIISSKKKKNTVLTCSDRGCDWLALKCLQDWAHSNII